MPSTRRFETNGEHLASYLLNYHLSGARPEAWQGVETALSPTRRATEWVQAIQEMTSLQLARRLIGAGSVLHTELGAEAAERAVKQMIIDTMLVHYSAANDIHERLRPAIKSCQSTVSAGTRRAVTTLTEHKMPYCYLCGTELDFSSGTPSKFTIDHVWPRAYGGGSVEDNLLGACRTCNGIKADTPSWALYPIQSFFAGFRSAEIADWPRTMPLAVRARKAGALALASNLSLRDAYIQLGRPGRLDVHSADTAADFFNLAQT